MWLYYMVKKLNMMAFMNIIATFLGSIVLEKC